MAVRNARPVTTARDVFSVCRVDDDAVFDEETVARHDSPKLSSEFACQPVAAGGDFNFGARVVDLARHVIPDARRCAARCAFLSAVREMPRALARGLLLLFRKRPVTVRGAAARSSAYPQTRRCFL